MNCEKRYYEAMERFKAFKEKYYTKDTSLGDVIFDKTGEMQKDFESIFPELRESEEQKPAERNHEDEMRNRIIGALIATSTTTASRDTYKEEIEWLRSLRPVWKPSEESMPVSEDTVSWRETTH